MFTLKLFKIIIKFLNKNFEAGFQSEMSALVMALLGEVIFADFVIDPVKNFNNLTTSILLLSRFIVFKQRFQMPEYKVIAI